MINHLLRGFGALSLAIVPLLAVTPAQAAQAPQGLRAAEVTTFADAIGQVRVDDEDRTGYTRSSFKHWNSGDLADGCNTRNEVLLAEAITAPVVGAGCKLTGGVWLSYYDGQQVTDPGTLDIDHMVPLAEAWDSGASAWTPARREGYANDQGAATSLVAVTARTNRQKSDQDPAEWLPPAPEAQCRYVGEWVATKLRWQLSADAIELEALKVFADGPCEDTVVSYQPAP
ncbi:HNH endonuclease family protein [[Kitasatospora] papulosa]|uniref:HNH endonuclease family protein n=1 Tax=Streptomyces TaxID=1883 RepID=UPI0025B47F93|nr:HNH endonuclease family protein [Streptomyces sp. P9-2B-1]WJY35441.1 HNH endonuclease family protein [Streptomyces sp. P9-2B-1]